MTYFPFDTQKCSLRYGSWSYSKEFIHLLHQNPKNDLIGAVSSQILYQKESDKPKNTDIKGQKGELQFTKNSIESKEWEIISKDGIVIGKVISIFDYA